MPFLNNKKHLPLSEHISKTIICLPMYKGLNAVTLSKITKLINKNL
jgi:dTDP-4-amino-4,6-dideoxygalactose transaminase